MPRTSIPTRTSPLWCGLIGLAAWLPAQASVVVFDYTGAAQKWTPPDSVFSINVVALGAAGGNNSAGVLGGMGDKIVGTVVVTPGSTIRIDVGGKGGDSGTGAGGFGGGGAGGNSGDLTGGAGGGGASSVFSSVSGAGLFLAAAGGGGAGSNSKAGGRLGSGGGGGGGVAGGGGGGASSGAGGGAASGKSPGAGGKPGGIGDGKGGLAGQPTAGGAGGASNPSVPAAATGQGGGGGNGGAAGASGTNGGGGGGGGGASYTTGVQPGAVVSSGVNAGNGKVTIEYFLPTFSGSLVKGSVIDFGDVASGASVSGPGLTVENTGEAKSALRLLGLSLLDSGFSLLSGDAYKTLTGDGTTGSGDDRTTFQFGFDATGLSVGEHSWLFSVETSLGSMQYTLRANVLDTVQASAQAAVPEPGSLLLVALAGLALGATRRRPAAG